MSLIEVLAAGARAFVEQPARAANWLTDRLHDAIVPASPALVGICVAKGTADAHPRHLDQRFLVIIFGAPGPVGWTVRSSSPYDGAISSLPRPVVQ
jgi:hypothetical protein